MGASTVPFPLPAPSAAPAPLGPDTMAATFAVGTATAFFALGLAVRGAPGGR